MNPITQYKKAAFLVSAVIAMGAQGVLFAECKPCAAAAAVKQSIKDAQAAALEAKPAVKPSKPSKPKRDQELDPVNVSNTDCEFCVQNGYCAASNASCNVCQSRLLQLSLVEVAAAALSVASELAQLNELDVVVSIDENKERVARESLEDICPFPDGNDLDAKLQALFNCCVCANQQIRCQTKLSEKCCKKLRHRVGNIQDSLGDPDTASFPIPPCSAVSSIVDVINDADVDVMTWLKGLYVLLFNVYQCACTPCIEG